MEHKDPVCGMTVVEGKEAAKSEYKAMTYYFCSRGCKVAFEKSPTRFVNDDGSLKAGGQMSMGHH
ncbi:MAG: YHS domain-containing protein [Chloroflexota bacterium]|nr:YHS domain-containing protein [Chloroflexota bacterium]